MSSSMRHADGGQAPFEPRRAIALLGEQIVPLYLHYIDDHITRLAALERRDLAGAFERWRARLMA